MRHKSTWNVKVEIVKSSDIESGCTRTIINEYIDSQKCRDRKVQNSVGITNALKITCKSDKKEGDSKYRVQGQESVKKKALVRSF
jgi:hypothetical protein